MVNDQPEETYYEQAARYVSEIEKLVDLNTSAVVKGLADSNLYWERVGFIKGLHKALELFIRKGK